MTPAPDPANHLFEAKIEAVSRLRAQLQGTDLARAAALGGLALDAQGNVEARLFGRLLTVDRETLTIDAPDGRPIPPVARHLVLRYLAAGRAIQPEGREITFRDLAGGQFYLQPVLNRTAVPLVNVFGNDLDRLRAALDRVPHAVVPVGDLGARIPAIGRLDITLVYRRGDEEFPPEATFLFDRALASVYDLSEAAALVNHFAMLLIRS